MFSRKTVALAFRDTAPIMAGYIFLGIPFGLLMKTSGYPLWYPVVMSLIIYSGALEYAAVPILAQEYDPLGTFFLGFMISIRHLFYGIPMLSRYAGTGAAKPFLIFGLTDETFSLLSAPNAPVNIPGYSFLVTVMDWSYWNIGTLLGAFAGQIINFTPEGLDYVPTALFIVLFMEQIRTKPGIISGCTGLIATIVALVIFGGDGMIAAAMVLIVVLLIAERRVMPLE